jgi:hypothetical protein
MVEFFNKKEEVLDLQLTEYGKYLLSLGRLRPEYYAFFDDDVLYDPECGGFTEHQNSTEGRIKDETPSLKIIPQITSAETRVGQFINDVSASISALTVQTASSDIASAFNHQPFRRTPLSNIDPLGNSSLAKSYAPAWSIEVPIGEISSSVDYISARNDTFPVTNFFLSGAIHNIPQLNIEIDYKVFAKSGGFTAEAISGELNGTVYLAARSDYLFLDILEENTDFLKENFEIEVFHSGAIDLQQVDSEGGVQGLQPGAADSEPLTSLAFMTDDSSTTPKSLSDNTAVPNVEYYMNILTDREIPDSILEQAGVLDRGASQTSTRLRLTRDLYTTENEEPCD